MTAPRSVTLVALDGTNPLGFLAALGTVVVARAAGETDARLRWTRSRTWVPVLDGLANGEPAALCETLVRALRGNEVSPEVDRKRVEAERSYKRACTAVANKMKEIKKQGLRGRERREAIDAHVGPLHEDRDLKRREWLRVLLTAVARRELALGARIDCTAEEYREHAGAFLDELDGTSREPLDLLSAFGSDANIARGKVEPTPFCFTRGSGHQDFLDTVRKLIAKVSAVRVKQALFEPWAYRDPKLSLRWDPTEDRRYALTDRKPADEGAWTVWMANLLAYRALALLPCAPARRGLGTPGWMEGTFTWPIWEFPAAPDAIRSLLQLQELVEPRPGRSALRARGIAASFRASRIRFPPSGPSYKWNFSPARAV